MVPLQVRHALTPLVQSGAAGAPLFGPSFGQVGFFRPFGHLHILERPQQFGPAERFRLRIQGHREEPGGFFLEFLLCPRRGGCIVAPARDGCGLGHLADKGVRDGQRVHVGPPVGHGDGLELAYPVADLGSGREGFQGDAVLGAAIAFHQFGPDGPIGAPQFDRSMNSPHQFRCLCCTEARPALGCVLVKHSRHYHSVRLRSRCGRALPDLSGHSTPQAMPGEPLPGQYRRQRTKQTGRNP